MVGIAFLRVLIAAIWPVAAAAGERGRRRVVLTGRSTDQRGGTLVYRPRAVPVRAAQAADVASPGAQGEPLRAPGSDPGVLTGYARYSTDKQDLAAQRQTLRQLGVSDDLAISIAA